MFDSLYQTALENQALHLTVKPDFSYSPETKLYSVSAYDNDQFVPFEFNGFGLDGVNYLIYALTRYLNDTKINADVRSLLGKPEKLCKLVNDVLTSYSKKETYVAVFVNSGSVELVGFLTSYIPKHHWEVLDLINEFGFSETISSWECTAKRMIVRFGGTASGRLKWCTSLKNGETGHVAIGYCFSIQSDTFVVDVPFKSRNRHQSKVGVTLTNFAAILDELSALAITEILSKTPTSEFVFYLDDPDIQEKFGGLMITHYASPIGQFMAEVGELLDTRGYKTLGTKLLENLTKAVLERAQIAS
jgi:hypothetical protein